MENETKDERRKRLSNDRQKRYYKKNADKIKKLAQDKRDKLIELETKCGCDEPVLPKDTPITVFNLENIIAGINALTMNEYTKTRNIRDISIVFRLTGCDILGTCLKSFKKIKKALEDSPQIQNPTQKYGVNSKRGFVQSILFVLDKFNIQLKPEIRKQYDDYYSELKIESSNITKMRQNDPTYAVMMYPDYLQKIKEKFNETSKEYLIARLYSEVVARDNFGNIEIIDSPRQKNKLTDNYIVVPRSKTAPVKVIIQSYKTIRFYGVKTITLSTDLSNLIRQYITKNGLTKKLFPTNTKGLSSFVGTMNRKIGVSGSINTLRQMYATTILSNKDITPAERLELSNTMMNSPIMSLNYQRLLQ